MRKLEFLDIVRAQDRILFQQIEIPGFPNADAEARIALSNTAYKLIESKDQALIDSFADHPEDIYQEITDTVTASGKADFKSYRAVMNVADGIKITNSKANYIEYLQEVLCRPYFKALAEYGLPCDQPIRLIKNHAEKVFKRKPKELRKKAEEPSQDYWKTSSSTIIKRTVTAFTGLSDIPIATRQEAIKKGLAAWQDKPTQGLAKVHFKEDLRELEITMPNISGNIIIVKLFLFLLSKVNEQAFSSDGKRAEPFQISFTLQELVNEKIYSTTSNAYRGLFRGTEKSRPALEILTQTKIFGEESAMDGKSENNALTNRPFFRSNYEKARGQGQPVIVRLEELQNWEAIMQTFTILPKWCFSLDEKAFLCAFTIFFTARVNASHGEPGKFKIYYKQFQKSMNLRNEKAHENPTDRIIKKIESSIQKVVSTSKKYEPIRIKLHKPENASPYQILDKAYITGSLTGYAKRFMYDAIGRTQGEEEPYTDDSK